MPQKSQRCCGRTSLLFTRLLIALLLSSPALAPARQWPSHPVPEAAALLQETVRSGIREGWLRQPMGVTRFYRHRHFQPAWFNRRDLRPEAGDLWQTIRHADREGLRPADYHTRAIGAALKRPAHTPRALAVLDLMLTDAFLAYASDVSRGRIDPRQTDPDWLIPRSNGGSAVKKLERALANHTLEETLRALPPAQEGYRRLRKALAFYRKILARGGWPLIPDGESLWLGMQGPRVSLLRQRLRAGGDLLQDDAEQPDRFDGTLQQAVCRFQTRHGLERDGVVGPRTLAALNVPVQARIRQVTLNMARWRWLPHHYGKRYLIVNMANFELRVVAHDRTVLHMRVIVGTTERQTPELRTTLNALILNPYWYMPQSIFAEEILPRLQRNPDYLDAGHLHLFQYRTHFGHEVDPIGIDWNRVDPEHIPYVLRQDPGPHNSLGRIKFELTDSDGIYLHDTPDRALFGATVRTFSAGCIRLQHPLRLANYLLRHDSRWNSDTLANAIATGKTLWIHLRRPIPVYLVYWTAWADAHGRVQFRDDIYGRDARLQQAIAAVAP